MGTYRVNQITGMFPGARGSVFEAADGPTLKAYVAGGVLSRIDAPVAEVVVEEETGSDEEVSPRRGRPRGSRNKPKEDSDGESA